MSKLSNSEEEETVTTEQVALGKYNAKGETRPSNKHDNVSPGCTQMPHLKWGNMGL